MTRQDKDAELRFFDRERNGDYELLPETCYERIRKALETAAPFLRDRPATVLELGCGSGVLGRRVLEWFPRAEVTGCDLAPAMIDWIRRLNVPRYRGVVGDAEDESLFAPGGFDAVLCLMVLHHFPDPRAVLRNAARWLKPDGACVIAEPNGSSPVNRLFKAGRHLVERTCGLDFAARFATRNETDHPLPLYLEALSAAGFEIPLQETFLLPPGAPSRGLLNHSRNLLNRLGSVLPRPYGGNVLLVAGRRTRPDALSATSG